MAEYGVPDELTGTLQWERARARLEASQNYWVVTVGPSGMPQATPVWGVWLDDRFYFGCGADTQKARNIARNPRVAVHLESGSEVVIVRGTARLLGAGERPQGLSEAMRAKYGAGGSPEDEADSSGPLYEVTPRTALAWANFPRDVTRWDFGEPGAPE